MHFSYCFLIVHINFMCYHIWSLLSVVFFVYFFPIFKQLPCIDLFALRFFSSCPITFSIPSRMARRVLFSEGYFCCLKQNVASSTFALHTWFAPMHKCGSYLATCIRVYIEVYILFYSYCKVRMYFFIPIIPPPLPKHRCAGTSWPCPLG